MELIIKNGIRDHKMKKILIILLILILVIFLVSSCLAASGSGNNIIDTIKIGDATGDWGFPSPYGMYSRGPGYIRMSLIFDTLVWKDREGNIIPMLAENWDYDESSIVSGMVRELTLSLSVSSSIIDIETFDFDIIITASMI